MKQGLRRRWLAPTVAIASMCVASVSLADPFSPSVADIQALSDNTLGFSNSNQLSTIDAITMTPDGIMLDVTWRTGQMDSSFDPFFGETFTRVVLSGYQNGEDNGTGRLLFPGYDGIKWNVASDVDVSAQPYLQPAPDWTYYQVSSTIPIPGDTTSTMATLMFDDAQNFSGLTPDNIVHTDVNGEIRSNSFGLQIFGPSPALGEEIQGQIWITNAIPEPGAAALLVMSCLGLAARRRG